MRGHQASPKHPSASVCRRVGFSVVMQLESAANKGAVSPKRAMGLMQVMLSTAE
jgi:hypothetical protein